MPDISLTGGTGARKSRSSRTRLRGTDPGTPSTRSRDFQRTNLAAGTGVSDATRELGQAFTSFFPGIQKAQEVVNAEAMRQERKRNREEIARLEAEVRKDPEAAAEAVKTGDFSAFIPSNDLRRREVIASTFKSVTAREMAFRDFANELQPAIQETPLSGNPDQTVDDFLTTQLKGADPVFAAEYTNVTTQLAREESSKFREARQEAQQDEALRSSRFIIQQQIQSGQVPITADGLVTMRQEFIGALPVQSAEAVSTADENLDALLIQMAAGGDARARRLLELPDPNRDGLSVMARRPGDYQAAVDEHIKSLSRVRSIAAHSDIRELDNRIALVKAGRSDEAVDDIWADIWNHWKTFGESAEWRSLRDQVASQVSKEGNEIGNVQLVLNGRLPNDANGDWDDTALAWFNGRFAEIAAREFGIPEQAAQAMALKAIAMRGSGSKLKQQSSNILLGSTDRAELEARYTELKKIALTSNRDLRGRHLSPLADNVFDFMTFVEEGGLDPFAANATFLENKEDRGDPFTHYERRLVDPGARGTAAGKTFGRGGVNEVAKAVWSDFSDPKLEVSEGMLSFLVGPDKPDFDELSPVIQQEIAASVNVSSFMLADNTANPDELAALASRLLRGRFGVEMRADGEPQLSLDHTPAIMIDAQGHIAPGEPIDLKTLKRAKEHLTTDPAAQRVLAQIGGFGGLAQDIFTGTDRSLAVQSNANGFPEDIALEPGTTFAVPAEVAGEERGMLGFFQEMERTGERVTFRVPLGDTDKGGGIAITPQLRMVFNDATGKWLLRYFDFPPAPEDKSITVDDLGARQDEARASRVESPDSLPGRGRTDFSQDSGPVSEPAAPAGRAKFFGRSRSSAVEPIPAGRAKFFGRGHMHIRTPEEVEGVSKRKAAVLRSMSSRGITRRAISALPPKDDAGLTTLTTDALLKASDNGDWLDDITRPVNERHLRVVSDFIEDQEGRQPLAYDDRTGRTITPGSKVKGNATIGAGFNLNRPDAKRLIEEVGGDFDKISTGRQALTNPQIDKLTGLAAREAANWLKRTFKGVLMPNHRWVALISLAYNSRWTKAGPTLVGPRLQAAVREGRWEDAAREIEFNSSGGVAPSQLEGIRARRKREAAMFRGAFEALKVLSG